MWWSGPWTARKTTKASLHFSSAPLEIALGKSNAAERERERVQVFVFTGVRVYEERSRKSTDKILQTPDEKLGFGGS